MDENKLNALNQNYIEKKETNDVLKAARMAVTAVFPQVENDTDFAWQALTCKPEIKKFYNDFVVGDYATEQGKETDDAEPIVKKALHEFFSSIKGNPDFGGTDAYTNYCKEICADTDEDDFHCDLLPAASNGKPLNFPKATLNIIAGRPSAGKTTALTSFAMHALRTTKKQVLFVTSEETPKQLITRFIKNQFCYNCLLEENNKGGKHDKELLARDFSKAYINDTFKGIIKKHHEELDGTQNLDAFSSKVLIAAEQVEDYIKTGRLQIFDLERTTNFEELKERLQEMDRNSIFILDYLQNLPFAPVGTPNNDRLEVLRKEIFAINTIVKVNELIGIAGAQFNREGAAETNPDPLELNKLGDSGEIERKAHIVIGLGRKIIDTNTLYFYRVLKDREGSVSTHYVVEDYYQYSFLQAKKGDDKKLIAIKIPSGNPKPPKEQNKDTEDKKEEPNTIQKGKAILRVGGNNK